MCRNIRVLYNFEPPATEAEIREASLQFVRKVSGYRTPSAANEAAFRRAVEEISHATTTMLDELVTHAPPKSREAEAERAKLRAQKTVRHASAIGQRRRATADAAPYSPPALQMVGCR